MSAPTAKTIFYPPKEIIPFYVLRHRDWFGL
jgi:hypothetical protein